LLVLSIGIVLKKEQKGKVWERRNSDALSKGYSGDSTQDARKYVRKGKPIVGIGV